MDSSTFNTALTGALWIALVGIFLYVFMKERGRGSGNTPRSVDDIGEELERLKALHTKASSLTTTLPTSTLKWKSKRPDDDDEEDYEDVESSSPSSSSHEGSQEGGVEEEEESMEEGTSSSSSSATPRVRDVKMQFIVLNKGSKSVRKIDPLTIARDAAGLAVKNVVRIRTIDKEAVEEQEEKATPADWMKAYVSWSTRGVTKISLRCDSREDFNWITGHAKAGSEDVGVPPGAKAKVVPPPSLKKKKVEGEGSTGDEGAAIAEGDTKLEGVDGGEKEINNEGSGEEDEEPLKKVGKMPVSIVEYHKDALIAAIGPYYADELALLTGHLKLLA